ncbi:MAG: class II fumarate hydratase [Acidobacteria bacterium]|nr:class II fumarate hydratase [Thermoanaerobaculia bacterium]MDI9630280.1 class II fumarate hydratase [Acidobacteriota bacterium]MBP7812791.1 class II fumarate hydratase [Thermoanaerobaculia bacterium]MBP8845529.1 class II fumarate hydratase [Thermoanaerobaculia bacterium]NLN10467.1 class II fumarate hydratase [Acidobacteriota bacterium]
MAATRNERDSLGEIEVPAEAYWGAQSERARRNFPVSGLVFPRRFFWALGLIKAEAAAVNAELGVVAPELAEAIRAAAEEVVAGELDAHFPLDIFQTGSGTSTNMNANEVIANRANERLGGARGTKSPVHPNDHVNASQSSNDVIPTAIHVAAYAAVAEELEPALAMLATALAEKAAELDDVVKIGRTHLQDAVPVRLGQELGAHAQQIRNGLARVAAARPRLAELALGGTAVGTGLNAPPDFARKVIARLAARTGFAFVGAPNRFEAIAARDAAVELSGALRTVAVSLTKIANDLRWLASGPRCGLGELVLPSLQPGSSIMPGKVNPVIPEMVVMVAAQVMGNDVTIGIAGAGGHFELNAMLPVIAWNLLQSIRILANASELFATRCVAGLAADRERCQELVERSLAMVTSLVPRIGYDRAAAIAAEAMATGRTVRELCVERQVLPPDELAEALDPRGQTEGGIQTG